MNNESQMEGKTEGSEEANTKNKMIRRILMPWMFLSMTISCICTSGWFLSDMAVIGIVGTRVMLDLAVKSTIRLVFRTCVDLARCSS